MHSEDSTDVSDVLLLGSVQERLSHQLLLRYQLQLFILMEKVLKKTFKCLCLGGGRLWRPNGEAVCTRSHVNPLAPWGWCFSLEPYHSGGDFAVSRTGVCWKLLVTLRKKGEVAAGESD